MTEQPAEPDTTDIVQRAREALAERDHPTPGGHGHVRPRVDGYRARCGGPRICKVCQQEAARTPDPWSLVRELVGEVEKLRSDFADEPYLSDRLRDARRERDEAQVWAAWFAAERDHVRAEVERLRRERTWPKTTPTGITYTAPETYAELCLQHDNAAQASVEGWEDSECPPEPTWEMVGLAHREVEKLRAEVEKLRAGRVADVELAKASWRDITEAAGLAWRDDDPSMVPGLIESIADLRAPVERVREANECLHAHRFDLDPAEDAGHDAWLESLGERRAGGPDVFYNGVEFAHRRICRALDGEAGRG